MLSIERYQTMWFSLLLLRFRRQCFYWLPFFKWLTHSFLPYLPIKKVIQKFIFRRIVGRHMFVGKSECKLFLRLSFDLGLWMTMHDFRQSDFAIVVSFILSHLLFILQLSDNWIKFVIILSWMLRSGLKKALFTYFFFVLCFDK